LVFEDDKKVYFIAETKSAINGKVDQAKLRHDEQLKIKCGEAHFREFEEMEYRVVSKVDELA